MEVTRAECDAHAPEPPTLKAHPSTPEPIFPEPIFLILHLETANAFVVTRGRAEVTRCRGRGHEVQGPKSRGQS